MLQQSPSLHIASRSKRDSAQLLWFVFLYLSWYILLKILQHFGIGERFWIIYGYGLLSLLFWGTAAAVRLARSGGRRPPPLPLWTGLALIVGGIWFDIGVTLVLTPDLAREANQAIHFFWAARYPDWFLYAYMFAWQGGVTVMAGAIWIAFLRHIPAYLNLVWTMDPRNLFQFLAASLGVNLDRPAIRWRRGEFPRSYRLVWICALSMNTEPFGRYVVALDWLGKVPDSWGWTMDIIGTGAALLTAALFLLWLTGVYISRRFLAG
jgi:hypothetical protein